MKIKKILKLIILIVIMAFIMLNNNSVNAAGYDITATSYDVKVGDSVTINVSFTAAAWDIVVSGKGITEGVYAGYTDDLSEKTTKKSISLDTSNVGIYTITMTGSITDQNGQITKINKSISVNVSKKENNITPPTDTNSGNNTQTPVAKSTEAKLKTLGIRPNDFSGFSKNRNKEDWSVEVPNSVTEVEVYATAMSDKAKVEGTGKISLKEGNNIAKIKVTAEAGNTKTYTLTIKRKTADEETKENGEARLKNLGIKPEQYDFKGFKSDTMEYSVEVPNEIKEIEVYATAMNSKAQITGTGMTELKEGENELKVEVIAEDGTKKTYILNVTRKETEVVIETTEEKLGLSTLSIEGIDINPSFKSNIYEYTATIKAVMVGDSLNITAKANDENATVEIIGNENFQDGENVITILVNNEITKENATYQIIVDKQVELEIVEKTSWLRPSTWGKEEIIKVAIILVLIILIVFAVILKVNLSKESEKRKLPGADELDKAMTEHQELSEEPNYIEDIAGNRFPEYGEEVVEEKTKRKGRHF